MKKLLLLLLVFSVCLSHALNAENLFEKIRLNGFLSQAYMKSSKNNFLTRSTEGSFEINELGFTVSTDLTDKLRLGFQLFSRDLGDLGNNTVHLDWAFGDYRLTNWLGIRLGKVKAPMGLYNEGRDTDFLRPMAFLPQGIYIETYRGFIVAYQGLGLYGNINLNKLGELGYHVYAGTNNISKDETLVKHIGNMISQYAKMPVPDFNVNTKRAKGGKIEWDTPITGLKTAVSYLDYYGEMLLHAGMPEIGHLKVPHWWILSLEFVRRNFTLSAEYSEMKTDIALNSVPTPLELKTHQAFYVMVSYMLTKHITLTGLVDIFYRDKEDRKGKLFLLQHLPDYMGWRKDYGACLRYDFNDHWTVKAEYHTINGAALYIHLYNTNGFVKDWNYFIFKTSFNF
ncbi:MAG: hypothetical protein ACM3SY_08715 [Candidatus Omnitrophota bacterium]